MTLSLKIGAYDKTGILKSLHINRAITQLCASAECALSYRVIPTEQSPNAINAFDIITARSQARTIFAGFVDGISVDCEASNLAMHITARSALGNAIDSHIGGHPHREKLIGVPDIPVSKYLLRLLSPWFSNTSSDLPGITTNPAGAGLLARISSLEVEPTDKIGDVIARIARAYGVIVFEDITGTAVVASRKGLYHDATSSFGAIGGGVRGVRKIEHLREGIELRRWENSLKSRNLFSEYRIDGTNASPSDGNRVGASSIAHDTAVAASRYFYRETDGDGDSTSSNRAAQLLRQSRLQNDTIKVVLTDAFANKQWLLYQPVDLTITNNRIIKRRYVVSAISQRYSPDSHTTTLTLANPESVQ